MGAGHVPRQGDWPGSGHPALCRGWGDRGPVSSGGGGRRGVVGGAESGVGGPSTHWVPALFSEKKRSTKSPSLLGSKVDGTTTYSPGGRRKRVLTSRRLMNCSERARDALARKKSRFRCTAGRPISWREGRRERGLQLPAQPTLRSCPQTQIQTQNQTQIQTPGSRFWPSGWRAVSRLHHPQATRP